MQFWYFGLSNEGTLLLPKNHHLLFWDFLWLLLNKLQERITKNQGAIYCRLSKLHDVKNWHYYSCLCRKKKAKQKLIVWMLFFSLNYYLLNSYSWSHLYHFEFYVSSNIPKSAFMKILCDNYRLLESVSIKELGATHIDTVSSAVQLTQQLFWHVKISCLFTFSKM